MASMALVMRFMTTWRSWLASPRTAGSGVELPTTNPTRGGARTESTRTISRASPSMSTALALERPLPA